MHHLGGFLLAALLSILALAAAQGEDGGQTGQPQPQQVQLTQEMVSHLLTVLSPPCRSELEQLLEGQGDVTVPCQQEIQYALSNQPRDGLQGDEEGAAAAAAAAAAAGSGAAGGRRGAAAPKANTSTVVIAIVSFVVLLFGALGGFVVYVNSKRASAPGSPKKPIGAKKQKREFLAGLRKKN